MGKDRTIHARNESLFATIFATGFAAVVMSCEPMWIKNSFKPGAWVTQEEATVCINVDNESLSETIEAVKAWDTAIGSWKHLIPVVGTNKACDYIIEETEAGNDVSIQALASTRLFGRRINLYKNRYELDVIGVVLHEIGHVLGARHMEGTLMAPQADYGKYKCPDAATVAQVAMVNGINPSLFSWCKNY